MTSAAVVLLALGACKGPPARFVAGIADTVVLNNRLPVPIPMRVFDAAGHSLPDTGVRYQWTSGTPVPVSQRGVVTCVRAGDATLVPAARRRDGTAGGVAPDAADCEPLSRQHSQQNSQRGAQPKKKPHSESRCRA
jgi:hypothetical protein